MHFAKGSKLWNACFKLWRNLIKVQVCILTGGHEYRRCPKPLKEMQGMNSTCYTICRFKHHAVVFGIVLDSDFYIPYNAVSARTHSLFISPQHCLSQATTTDLFVWIAYSIYFGIMVCCSLFLPYFTKFLNVKHVTLNLFYFWIIPIT